jgi:hypothetical protein
MYYLHGRLEMGKLAWVVALILLFPVSAVGQVHRDHSQHASARSEIKALSSDLVRGLLGGDGVGYALAAELNRFPGPRHVLDLREELSLSEEQFKQVSAIFVEMNGRARDLGARLVEAERELDGLFRDRLITEDRLKGLVSSIGEIEGELRYVHLEAHVRTTRILSHDQIGRYVQERGHGHDRQGSSHQGH